MGLLGNGVVINRSKRPVWVLEDDRGRPTAHILAPNRRSPKSTDADAVKGMGKVHISGHGEWWKIIDIGVGIIHDGPGNSLALEATLMTSWRVDEKHFGFVKYDSAPGWGEALPTPGNVKPVPARTDPGPIEIPAAARNAAGTVWTPAQLLDVVIRPALKLIGKHSESAEQLLLGTAIQESRLKYRRQLGNGPARGIFQMEPATHNDIWLNYLKYHPVLGDLIASLLTRKDADKVAELETNDAYACAMARMVYARAKPALPNPGDIHGHAAYWKQHYNTPLGKGTPEEFVLHWEEAMKVKVTGSPKVPTNKPTQGTPPGTVPVGVPPLSSATFKKMWKSVKLTKSIEKAFRVLEPHLPNGAVMTSGYRSDEDQARIINEYYASHKGPASTTDVEERRLWLKAQGLIIAKVGSSPHRTGLAFDLSGAPLSTLQECVDKAAAENPTDFPLKRTITERKQNCLHVDLLR